MEKSKNIFDAYISAFTNYFKFSGRATRYDFWGFRLIDFTIAAVLSIFAALWNPASVLSGLYTLATLFPSLAFTSRRLHDVGKSFWWFWGSILLIVLSSVCGAMSDYAGEDAIFFSVLYILVVLATIVYSFYLLYLTCKKSCDDTKFGEPLKEDDVYVKRSKWFIVAYFAIIAALILSVAVIAGYSKAIGKYEVNKAVDQIAMLQANIHELFKNSDSYDGLSAAFVVEAGAVPEDMLGGTQLVNPFGGLVGVMGHDKMFMILYSDVPLDACKYLSEQNWGSSLLEMSYNFGEAQNCQECVEQGCELGWVFK